MENNNNNNNINNDNITFGTNEHEELNNAEQMNTNEITENYFSETETPSFHDNSSISEPITVEPSNSSLEYSNPIDVQYSEEKKTSKKKGFNVRILSYVATGLICSILGGFISSGIMLYANPSLKNPVTAAVEKVTNNSSTTSSSSTGSIPYVSSTSTNDLSVADIAKKVGPAVVGVSVKIGSSDPFNGTSSEGMGSGIIINQDGYILTNYHVIADATQVTIILNNGKEVPAKVVNYDATSDVAVVKTTDKTQMPAVAELGDSDKLQVGEEAVAIGNPLGKDFLGSVTVGVISAVNRSLDGETDQNGQVQQTGVKYIQTDAAINEGNSGGALVNSKGQVIGINSAKIKGTGVEGLGFAIPINYIKPKLQALVKPILKLGIAGQDVTDQIAQQYKLPIGFYVEEVQDFSPAEKAGLKAGDVIVKFDGQKVTSVDDINKAKGNHKAGDTVKVEIIRDGNSKTLEIKLSE